VGGHLVLDRTGVDLVAELLGDALDSADGRFGLGLALRARGALPQ